MKDFVYRKLTERRNKGEKYCLFGLDIAPPKRRALT